MSAGVPSRQPTWPTRRDRVRAAKARYRARNPAKIREYQAAYRAENKECLRDYQAVYHAANAERIAGLGCFRDSSDFLDAAAAYLADAEGIA